MNNNISLSQSDQLSIPLKKTKHKLTTCFFMPPRKNPKKPGRELLVNYDQRFPLIPNFKINYTYYVRFFEPGNTAGNHYHHKKQELFIPIVGNFLVELEDINSKEKEQIKLKQNSYQIMYVDTKIAHRVTALDKNSVLLVLATSTNNDDDEFDYNLD